MAKPLINTKKWSQDDFRLLVVLLLTVIYPIFVASFFALYLFILLPVMVPGSYTLQQAHNGGWYHYYWLFVSLLWVLLCSLILPCFRDKKRKPQVLTLDICESPRSEKPATGEPFVQIVEGNGKKRSSTLTDKSQNSSESIEKVICDEKAEKDSLGKSKESIQKSNASLSERKKLTQSGEFLNDFIDSLDSEELKKNEAECEVHAEESKDVSQNIKDSDNESQEDEDSDDHSTSDDVEEKEKMSHDYKDKDEYEEAQENDDKVNTLPKGSVDNVVVEPTNIEQKIEKQQQATPMNADKADVMKSKSSESLEEIDELEEVAPMRQKARPTIDTSRASGCYECSMPTPKSADVVRPESNMVFLFVNPDIASTEESIKVEHGAEIQDAEN